MSITQERNLDRLCPGCFEEKPRDKQCPHCGFDETAYENHPLHLAPRSMLLDRYMVGKVLGKGGFGITYLGYDSYFQQRVAIKEYLPSPLVGRKNSDSTLIPHDEEKGQYFQEGLRLFLEEARNIKVFKNNTNVVNVENFFEANETGYMVMEYIEGPALIEMLKKQGQMSWKEAIGYILPVIDALEDIHAANLYHRDVSPQNILLADGKTPKLIDFGAARQVVGESSHSLDVVLKPGYSPLEQYASRSKIGPWTDIYACAATIYHLLSGSLPPAATDRLMKDELKPVSELEGVKVPDYADECILRSLSVKAEDRVSSVGEFKARLLGQYEEGGGGGGETGGGTGETGGGGGETGGGGTGETGGGNGGKKSSRKMILAIVGVLIVAGVVLAMTMGGGKDDVQVAGEPVPGVVQPAPGAGGDAGGVSGGDVGGGQAPPQETPPPPPVPTQAQRELCTPCNVQNVLKARGLYRYKLDGLIGPGTRKAIKSLQGTLGVEATGEIDDATILAVAPLVETMREAGKLQDCRQAPELEAVDVAALLGQAGQSLDAGDCVTALSLCAKVEKAAPGNADVQALRNRAESSTGTLSISAVPWGYIHVDGEDMGFTTPKTGIELPCGRHVVKLVKPGYQDREATVTIRAGRKSTLSGTEDRIIVR